MEVTKWQIGGYHPQVSFLNWICHLIITDAFVIINCILFLVWQDKTKEYEILFGWLLKYQKKNIHI